MTLATGFGRVRLQDDFLGAALTGAFAGQTENSGTAAVEAGVAGGVVQLLTGTTSGNRSQLTAGLNWKAEDGNLVLEVKANQQTAVTEREFFAGFTDSVALEMPFTISTGAIVSEASDAVGFFYAAAFGGGTYRFLGVADDVDTTPIDTGVAPVAGVYDVFRVVVNPDGGAEGYIIRTREGVETVIWKSPHVAKAVTPDVLLTPDASLITRASSAKKARVDLVMVEGGRETQ